MFLVDYPDWPFLQHTLDKCETQTAGFYVTSYQLSDLFVFLVLKSACVYLTQIFQGHSCSASSHLTSLSWQACRGSLGGLSAPWPPPPLSKTGMGGEENSVELDHVHLSSASQQEINIITQKLSMLGNGEVVEEKCDCRNEKNRKKWKEWGKFYPVEKQEKQNHPSNWSVNLWGLILLTVTKQTHTLASSGDVRLEN